MPEAIVFGVAAAVSSELKPTEIWVDPDDAQPALIGKPAGEVSGTASNVEQPLAGFGLQLSAQQPEFDIADPGASRRVVPRVVRARVHASISYRRIFSRRQSVGRLLRVLRPR